MSQSAENQTKLDPLLLLTQLVTVPQNTLFPLIFLGLAQESPVQANLFINLFNFQK
jgi:hypothetical protein